MRVLLVDPSDRGGIAVYTDLIAQSLVAAEARPELLASRGLQRDSREYAVHRVLPVQRWGRPERAGLRFYLGRLYAWSRSTASLQRMIRRYRPDIVHFQFGFNRRLDAAMIRRIRRLTPVVWTAHDVLPFQRTPQDRARFASIYRTVDRLIVHGSTAAQEVKALAGVAATVIEHPSPRRLNHLTKPEARARLELPLEGRVIVAPGFIRSYKGYELLADVWESLPEPAPTLFVLGELLEDEERATVARLQHLPNVRVDLGYAPDELLETAVIAADAIALPYREASDSGLVHLARSLATPVLASDAPQLAESVTTTGAGVALRREVALWRAAVVGDLPPAPATPPALAAVGRDHVEVYESVLRGRAGELDRAGRDDSQPARHVVYYSDSNVIGGAEVSLRTLLGALDRTIAVTVVGVDARILTFLTGDRPDVPTILLEPVRNKFDAVRIRAHIRTIKELRPDVFHANLNTPWSCQYGLLAATLSADTKIVAVEHAPLPAANAMQRRLRHLLSSRVDVHVAVSEEAARTIEEYAGLPDSTIRVVHSGVVDHVPGDASSPVARPTIGAIGRLDHVKGYDVLLRALVDVPAAGALLVGDGPERQALETLARDLGLGERVLFTGWQEDARRWLDAMDVFVAPSRVEAFGLGIVEAMLAHVPVVAARVGGTGEAVIDDETGLLVPPDDPPALAAALRRLLDDEKLRTRLTHLARNLVATEFTPTIMAGRFEAIYREVTS